MTPDQPENHSPAASAPKRQQRGRKNSGNRSPQARRSEHINKQQQNLARRREAAALRRAATEVPPITFPEQLPVSARRAEISEAIANNQVVVLAGETGSGKTTQLPKILLELGRGRVGQIGHTQPRRIAARTVAERIAYELDVTLGGIVGYQVRFTDQSSDDTLVKVMTDGILLAEIQRDPQLLNYDTLIIDEAHERSLNIDFILGYLARLLPQRPDLKLIITSATIDSDRFAEHFASAPIEPFGEPTPAPVISVTGRTFPVELRYRPLGGDGGEDRDLMTGIIEAVDELAKAGPGDILVFLSGEREIHDAADALDGHFGERTRDNRHPQFIEILPLYARLSAAEQHRVFQNHPGRRIVLSTNVAETSLTVPGIRYVVDPGTARISRYSKATKVQRLPIEPISQASANQRSGRCGRVADGIAIRLYAEEDFDGRPEFTEPEILRTSLASVILQMLAVGVSSSPDDVANFPFVEPPDTRAVRDGVQLLTELGALSAKGTSLTAVGRGLAQLPMDPRLARMILESNHHGVVREVMIIAAALSIQDPRERPAEERAQADQLHARFSDPTSDFLTYLNLWEYLRSQQRDLSGSAFRRMCRREYLNFLRVREWQDVVAQLREMAKTLEIRVNTPPARSEVAGSHVVTAVASPDDAAPQTERHSWPADNIHRSILAGLLSQLGMQVTTEVKASSVAHLKGEAREKALKRATKQSRNEYLGARGARFAIFPGSPLSKKPPVWVMAGELVETSRLWGRDVAKVQPEWAESLAAHLVKYTYSDPAWSTKQGAAIAREKVLLYGVPIVADRSVLYGKVDPIAAREMFIRNALVDGEWRTHHLFFAQNAKVRAEAEDLEARSRRRGLALDDEALFAFYDERIPGSVISARHFDTWWKSAKRATPHHLDLNLETLVPEVESLDASQFPETWHQGELSLPLTYQFKPGTDADGVTVHVPITALNQVVPNGFDFMVPGLLEELVTATIRALPKPIRVQLVPAPDTGRAIAGWMRTNLPAWPDMVRAGDMAESFESAFQRGVAELRAVDVPGDALRNVKLPDHLRMTYRVTEARKVGAILLDESKDLGLLKRKLAAKADVAVRGAVRTALRSAFEDASGVAGTETAPHGLPGPRQIPGPGAAVQPDQAISGNGTVATGTAAVDAADFASSFQELANLTSWPSTVTTLPGVITTKAGAITVHGYPGLHADGGAISLRVFADQATRDAQHGTAVQRLLLSETALSEKRITTRWTSSQMLTMAASPYPTTAALVQDLQLAAVKALTPDAVQITSIDLYNAARTLVSKRIEDEVHRIVGDAVAALTASRELSANLKSSASLTLLATVTELRAEASDLIPTGFLSETPPEHLPHLVRYLRAASHRLIKAAEDPSRDGNLARRVTDVIDAYNKVKARRIGEGAQIEDLAEVPWMIRELRVSLFAQQLGTNGPISEKRIHKILGTKGW